MSPPKTHLLEGQVVAPVLDSEAGEAHRKWRLTGLVFALLGAALFSFKPVLIKLVYSHGVDTWTLMLLRMLFALPFIFLVALHAWYQRRVRGKSIEISWKTLASAAALGLMANYAAQYLDMQGLHYITAQFERLIIFTYPTLVVLISMFFMRERISGTVITSLIICYLGLALIFGHDLKTLGADVITGAGLTFLSALLFAVFFVASKNVILSLGSRIFTFLTIGFGTSAIAIHFSFVNDVSTLFQPLEVYGLILIISLTGTVLPLLLIAEAIARIGPSKTSIAGGVGPIFTSIAAVLMLGEAFTIYHGLGSALIITGVIMIATR